VSDTCFTISSYFRLSPLSSSITRISFNETVARTIDLLDHHRVPYVVAVEEQPVAVELMKRGISVICADPKYDEGLRSLNIGAARLVVATNADTDNIKYNSRDINCLQHTGPGHDGK
jgi:hypothetical protein